MRISRLSPDAAVASLHSSRDGLTADEAARRLAEFGPNRLEEVRRTPLWLRAARQFTHFFALVQWVAAALAFWGARRDPASGMATLGIAIVGVIVVNGVFSFWQEHRAEEAVAALKAILPRQATVLRDGAAQRLPIEALVPGDVVLVQEGDDVPADSRLLEATALRVNVATITGESLPKARTAAPTDEDDPLAARCVLLAGTAVVSGEGKALVFATGMRTEFGKIVHLTQAPPETPSPLQVEIARLSRLVAAAAVVLGVIFFAIGQAIGLGFWSNFLFAIGIIVANVPELIPYLAFVLFRIPLPLTIVQILAVDLGTDLMPALALGAEAPAKDTMQRPPRPREERLLTWGLLARAYLWLGMLEATAALAAFFFVLHGGGWRYGEVLAPTAPLYLEATTACLAAIVVMQGVNVFICRDDRRSAFAFGLASNPLLLWGVFIEIALILAIVYTTPGQALFGTAALPPAAWLFMLPFAVAMVALEEGRKAVVRARQRRSAG